MSNTATLLESLRDVREPLPPEGGPLWLIAANLIAAAIVLFLLWHVRRKRRYGWRKQLIDDLRKAQRLPPDQALMNAATMLRQLSLARGEQVQNIHGQHWLQHLDDRFDTNWFTHGNGQLLGDDLYRPLIIDNARVGKMLEELEELIKKQPFQPVCT